MKAKQVRETFLNFFKQRAHKIVSSAPLALKDDPSLMFINSGMAQFKDLFLGLKPIVNKRVADTQKCLRVSGKHNDLEDVGVDTYHHTFFEMLGNWSFGDYFKKEAINWAWELLTEVYEIPKEDIYVTVFQGDEKDNTPYDEEAYQIWSALVPKECILNGSKKDNFWEMGETGPCGPCSEIHVDIRSKEEKKAISGSSLVNQDHPQVIEIWNLVFMQYLRKSDGSLEKLPAQHVDTGMGFERLCMVLQGKQSNYDTDVFTPLIEKLEQITHKKYSVTQSKQDIAVRVIVDHIRAIAFVIADGQLPSNTGAGYVIRRILRRAVRYGYSFLDQKEPFLYLLVDVLVLQMDDVFPEIKLQKDFIKTVIKEEEQNFLRTLSQGLVRIEQIIEETPKDAIVSGEKVFELYDTFGFPADLTGLILSEKGLKYDVDAFDKALLLQKQRSKKAALVKTGDWSVVHPAKDTLFVGYDAQTADVKITQYRAVKTAKESYFELVFDKTPFYAESGGQMGDTGFIESGNQRIVVIDTKKENQTIVHKVLQLPNRLEDVFLAQVDQKRRRNISLNHTATHLLHHALVQVLGTHVTQKGSFVGDAYLRFDFSHFSKLTPEEVTQVENLVNEAINAAIPLEENRRVSLKQALNEGATALFGEKYENHVRTIRFGDSYELCGGTHVTNTRDMVLFKITSEGAVASGIRRIEAITGTYAIDLFKQKESHLRLILDALGNPADATKAIHQLKEENHQLKKELDRFKKLEAQVEAKNWENKIKPFKDFSLLEVKTHLDAPVVKDLVFQLKSKYGRLVVVVGIANEQKPILNLMITEDLTQEKGLHAGKIVKTAAQWIDGSGGGQAFFASAGGRKPDGLDDALAEVVSLL